MNTSKFNSTLVSLEAAWICAADVDVQREEEERVQALAKSRKQRVRDKYELASESMRLEQELKEQQLQWKKKAEQRRQRQSPEDVTEKIIRVRYSNNKKKPNVYAQENLRLTMLMKDTSLRQRVKKKKIRPRIVQDMLALERRYAEAARRLQKWWRRYLHWQFWRLYFLQVKAVVKIQRIARGYLTRRWVHIWHVNRTIRVTRLQALFRGYYIRWNVLPTWRRWEYLNAAKIQSIARMNFATKFCFRRKREIAALHIQAVWRGMLSRRRSDLRWLEKKAVNLQRFVRGTLARKRTRKHATRLKICAIQIQRMVRGMMARMKIDVLLRDRETRNRQEFMAVLEVEEEWHRAQRDKLQAKLNRKQLYQRVLQLEYEYFMKHEKIHDMESIYLDMQTQRMRVSPRAIEHGWVEEMEEKMKKQRALITKLKLDTIFGVGFEFKTKEKEMAELQQRISQIEEKRRRFEIWRNEEFLDYWERDCRFRYEEKRIRRHQHVAETRRRWQIKLYRTNGKPDNRWRGACWTEGVLKSAKEKEIFCIGSTNTFALIQDKWKRRMQNLASNEHDSGDDDGERNTREHISTLTDQVALTVAAAQIEQTKVIFDPVFQSVEQSFDEVQRQRRAHERHLKGKRQEQQRHQPTCDVVGTEKELKTVMPLISEDPTHIRDRQQRKRQLLLAAKVPWNLLDQLDAERHSFAKEKAMFNLWGKVYSAE